MNKYAVKPVNDYERVEERLPFIRLLSLGFQHVLVMYAGAVAVPLIVGRALKLSPEQVAMLVSADLFCCGIVTIIQSYGISRWFGIKLPVIMGVTFAAVGPMIAIASQTPGVEGGTDHLRLDHRRWVFCLAGGAARQPDRAAVSAGGYRVGDSGHRNLSDARWDQLDFRQSERANRAHGSGAIGGRLAGNG